MFRHNWDFDLTLSGSGMEAMGAGRSVNAAASLTAFAAMQDIYFAAAATDAAYAGRETAALLAAHWWSRQLVNNTVTIRRGWSSDTYVRRPGSARQTFTPPAGSQLALAQTGERRIALPPLASGVTPPAFDFCRHPTARQYWYDQLGFSLTGPDGDVMAFQPWARRYLATGEGVIQETPPPWPNCTPRGPEGLWRTAGLKTGFRPVSWAFPTGVDISFAYNDSETCALSGTPAMSTGCPVRLTQVSNNLGRSISWISVLQTDSGQFVAAPAGARGFDGITQAGSLWQAVVPQVDGTQIRLRFDARMAPASPREAPSHDGGLAPLPGLIGVASRYRVLLREVYLPLDAVHPSLRFSWDVEDRLAEVIYATGETAGSYTYETETYRIAAGRFAEVVDAAGAASATWFDWRGRAAATRNAEGSRAFTLYDGLSRVVEQRSRNAADPAGFIRSRFTFEYDRYDNRLSERQWPTSDTINPVALLRTWEYANTQCRTQATQAVDRNGSATSWTWTPSCLLATETGPSGEHIALTYNNRGLPVSVVVQATPSPAMTTTIAYVANRETPSSHTVSGPGTSTFVTSYGWNTRGDLVSLTNPRGHVTQASYDAARRLTGIERNPSLGARERIGAVYDYDDNGRLVRLRSRATASTWFDTLVSYGLNGRIASVTDPDGDTALFHYDARRLLLEAVDPVGRRTRYSYDALRRQTCERRAYGTASVISQRMVGYDRWGQLDAYWPARADPDADCEGRDNAWRTLITADAYGRQNRTIFPQGSDPSPTYVELTFDPEGNPLTRRTRAGEVQTMTYDASGRLATRVTPGPHGRVEVYAYDLAGRQTCAAVRAAGSAPGTCASGTVIQRDTWAYDRAGRLTSEAATRSGVTRTVSYQYDANGNRTRITWPDGWHVTYAYDGLDRMTTLTAQGGAVLGRYLWREHDGRLEALFLGGTAWGSGSSPARARLRYFWEADGDLERQELSRLVGATVNFTYGYAADGRLTSEAASEAGWLWTAATSRTVNYAGVNTLDQYGAVDGAAATWDANGNRASWGGLVTAHDSDNRLVTATRAGVTMTYGYDAGGRRVAASASPGASTATLWAGDMEIADYDGAGTLLRRYVPGMSVDQRIAMISCGAGAGVCPSAATHYYVPNRLGNVIAIVDAAGAVTDRYVYTPYGVEEPLAASGNPFRYTGRRYDAETGLYHYRARYYDAEWGRFLETDPVLYADQMNLYAYVGNDPLNATDPSGMCPECQWQIQQEQEWLDTLSEEERAEYRASAIEADLALLDGMLVFVEAGLVLVDLAAGGPTGEGILPAAAIRMARTGARETTEGAARRVRNPYGSRGAPDHQADVRDAGRDRARELARPGEEVVSERRVRGHPGVNRIPDNQVIGRDGRTRAVVESERNPNSARHRRRVEEYERCGIHCETRRLPPREP